MRLFESSSKPTRGSAKPPQTRPRRRTLPAVQASKYPGIEWNPWASLKITASGRGALTPVPLSHDGLTVPLIVAAAAHLIAAGVARLGADRWLRL